MTTYCETQGKKPFDWENYINNALETKKKLDSLSQERSRIVNMSGQWATNPIGMLSVDILRDRLGAPIDNELRKLGEVFINAMCTQNWKSARKILDLLNEKVNPKEIE